MKIYYTEENNNSFDGELEQLCPFNEQVSHKRADGSEYSCPICVGSNACIKCRHCYGFGFSGHFGMRKLMLIPVRFRTYEEKCNPNETSKGLKQYRYVSKGDYVKCEMTYNSIYREKSKLLKLKLWWWHFIGAKLNRFLYKLDKWRITVLGNIRMKFENLKYKIKK
ncbi:MAG: hypothetical protein IKO56_00490 [Alphaproteobacteria bacterium]|nr:hypothetical protein [Alphaproteobacteria bacterium]